MPQIRFTHSKLAGLSTSKNQEDFTDQRYPGLILRVYRSDRKAWLYRRSHLGKRFTDTLGVFPEGPMRPSDRRLTLKQAIIVWRRSDDPERQRTPEEEVRQLERKLEALKRQTGDQMTFKELVDKFLESNTKLRESSRRQYRRLLYKDPMECWESVLASSITRRQISDLLREVTKRAPTTANSILRVVRRMYRWAQSEELVETNPAWGIEMPTKLRARQRALQDEEVPVVWAALRGRSHNGLEPTQILSVLGDAALLCLLTGQRREEVCRLRWNELVDGGTWWDQLTNKPGRRHLVHLVPTARDVIARREQERVVSSPFVFASTEDPMRSVHKDSLTRAVRAVSRDLLRQEAVREKFTLHDLRRTVGTIMAKKGVPPHVRSRVLNHALPNANRDVTQAVYDVHDYRPEVENALLTVEAHLLEVLGDHGVVV